MKTFEKIRRSVSYHAKDKICIHTIDMHTGGEPLRIVTSGQPLFKAKSVLEYRKRFKNEFDFLRTRLIYEPRGHADMYGVYLVPPNTEDADFGVVFFHNEGYSTMCGHAIIALAKLAVEMNWVNRQTDETPVIIDAPCGRINAFVLMQNDEPTEVRFEGVPSFVLGSGTVYIEGHGMVQYTLAFGGAYYVYVDAKELGLDLHEPVNQLVELGMKIKQAVIKSGSTIEHPFEQELSFLYGTIFTGGRPETDSYDRNVCIFADGEVDRSPTGSGVSGRLAIHYFSGAIETFEEVKIESIAGSVFSGKVVRELNFGPFRAVIPEVGGEAFITGEHTFYFDSQDPFINGFLLD